MMRNQFRIGAIILARLDSTRLPGKGLLSVEGKPMLAYVVERAKAAQGVDAVLLATSDRLLDDPLESFAVGQGIDIFRGDLKDVSGRILGCARRFSLDAFARINGDSPLLDFQLLSRAVADYRAGDYDIVTNVLKRTFPPGMSVEIVGTEIMAQGYRQMDEAGHFEHVTKYFYERSGEYRIHNIESGRQDWDQLHAAVDTAEDMERFKCVVKCMRRSHLNYYGAGVVDLLRQVHKGSEKIE